VKAKEKATANFHMNKRLLMLSPFASSYGSKDFEISAREAQLISKWRCCVMKPLFGLIDHTACLRSVYHLPHSASSPKFTVLENSQL